MADNNTRRRVRETSESSECEENSVDNANESLTQCESEAGVHSPNVAELSESFDTCNNEDLSDENNDGTENEEDEDGAEEDPEHSETEDSDTDHASDANTEHDDRVGGQNDELSEDEKTVDEESDEDIAWQNEQRHSGDGEEQNATVKEKTDIDEDRTNPAFIPRKGYFYEHDMRLDENDEEKPEAKQSESKKKLWVESLRKWDHDHYDDRAQAPKSRAELISAYGYDIRLGSSPPKSPPLDRKRRNNPKQRGVRKFGDFIKTEQRPSRPVDIADTTAQSRRPVNHVSSQMPQQSNQVEEDETQNSNRNGAQYGESHREIESGGRREREDVRDGNRMNRYSQMRQQRNPAVGDQEFNRSYQRTGGRQRGFGESRHRMDVRSDEESRHTKYEYGGSGDYRRTLRNDPMSQKSGRHFPVSNRDGRRGASNSQYSSRNYYSENTRTTQMNSADWDDDRLAGDTTPLTKNNEKQHVQNEVTIEFNSNTRNQKLTGTQHHQTRTISNTNYRNVADADTHGRDRNKELSGIVVAMNKVSVSNESRARAASGRSSATAASNDVASDDFIPPVTSTYTRTTAPPLSSVNHGSLDQLPSSHEISKAASHLPVPPPGSFPVPPHQQYQYQQPVAGKPKRYSTQRQRNQPDVGEAADVAGGSEVAPAAAAMPSVSSGYALPPRLQRSKYHDEEDVHQPLMTYPQRALVATGPPQGNVNYSMSGMPVPPYYPAPEQPAPATNSPPSLMHAAHYLGAPPHMMSGPPPPPSAPYYPPQAVYSYAPPHHPQSPFMPPPQQYRMAMPPQQLRQFIPSGGAPSPQILTEVSPSMEVRGGTVYFNAETQQPELRVGGIYYGPAGQQGPSAALTVHRPSSAIPIINPQEATTAGASETAQYFADSAVVASYSAQYSNYVHSPMPYENTPAVTSSQENSAESAVA